MKKEENFSEWYNDIIERADLCDKRYPVKGMNVWRPYGWRAMQLIDSLIRREMDATGHQEVCFPLLIPKTEFDKEAEHIKGFNQEVYWVTHAGDNELDVPLLLRPTSETAMYPMFSLWVRSHSDLPLKVYQIVNTFRYETKQTRAFIRMREIHFFEAHTCHTDFEDAERQIKEDLEIMERIAKDLCLPYIATRRPDWDKFAGAYYSIGIDTLMPTGRTLQIGSIHQYRTNFAEAYDIKYETPEGEHRHVHQTTYGMSERLLGAIVGVHGDDKGLILPPAVAPIQVVVVPIFKKESRETVEKEAEKVAEELMEGGLRAHLDMRDFRPGYKFNDWEMRGVPLRVEIGQRDIEEGQVVLARRDTMEKTSVSRGDMVEKARQLLEEIAENLRSVAENYMCGKIKTIRDISEYEEGTIGRIPWCGSPDCGHEIEDALDVSTLGTPVEEEDVGGERCPVCGGEAKTWLYIAKTH